MKNSGNRHEDALAVHYNQGSYPAYLGQEELSEMMHSYWVNFAKCGDPNGEGLPAFPQNTDNKSVFEFGAHTGIIEDPYLALYEIMDRMQDKAA